MSEQHTLTKWFINEITWKKNCSLGKSKRHDSELTLLDRPDHRRWCGCTQQLLCWTLGLCWSGEDGSVVNIATFSSCLSGFPSVSSRSPLTCTLPPPHCKPGPAWGFFLLKWRFSSPLLPVLKRWLPEQRGTICLSNKQQWRNTFSLFITFAPGFLQLVSSNWPLSSWAHSSVFDAVITSPAEHTTLWVKHPV